MLNAFRSRDPANASNWYGTSLFRWNKCDGIGLTWKDKIVEAYTDSNKFVNFQSVGTNMDFNSAAALECFGLSG